MNNKTQTCSSKPSCNYQKSNWTNNHLQHRQNARPVFPAETANVTKTHLASAKNATAHLANAKMDQVASVKTANAKTATAHLPSVYLASVKAASMRTVTAQTATVKTANVKTVTAQAASGTTDQAANVKPASVKNATAQTVNVKPATAQTANAIADQAASAKTVNVHLANAKMNQVANVKPATAQTANATADQAASARTVNVHLASAKMNQAANVKPATVHLASATAVQVANVKTVRLGSIILAIILPNIGKYKNLKSIINKDYYGSFFASSLTLLVAGLLIYDYIVTENFSMKGSGMTKRQRRLHFSVLAVYIWTAIGAGVFMLIEKFEFSFAVYFCFVTITTIGFGDITPQNTSTKILTLVWLFIGVIIFGIYLLSARDVVAQILFKKYRKRIRWKVFHYNLHNKYANNSSAKIHSDTSYKTHPSRNHDLEAETSNTKKKIRGLFASMCLPFQLLRSLVRNFKFPKKFPIKRWTYPQALYFCFVSFTTVGYGDVTPSSKLSIIFFNFIIVIAVSNFAGYLGSVVELFQYLILSLLENNIIRHVQPEYNNNRKHFRLLRKILPNPSQNESNNDKFSTIFYPRSISEQSLELENENTNIGDYDIEKYSIRAASLPDIWPRKDI
ncbi:hypothetical protein BB558_001518 [Smittium angustum]|uniref:Potassium channel domain-containing protein n=1 Tax=Smittium angustum TaxID=133377 RepID=A0A2U1JB63_SMIAN|nr:hypothetical protein BB558_001518 [Smittium angustum]